MEKQNTMILEERVHRTTYMEFRRGIKTGIPIAIGYIPIAITFGLLAKSTGVSSGMSVMMSFLIFAGASQFVGVNLLGIHAGSWEIIATTFILNLRHFLMTASLSQRMEEGVSKKWMALLAFGVTDETFTVASLQKEERLSPFFILGLNLIAFSAWNVGTWMGVFLGTALPQSIQDSMGIALYTMFIGLLIPSVKQSRSVLVVSVTAIVIHSILNWVPAFASLSAGWNIIIATIGAAAVGAIIFEDEEEKA